MILAIKKSTRPPGHGKLNQPRSHLGRAWTIRISCGSHNTLDAADLLSMMGVAECDSAMKGRLTGFEHRGKTHVLLKSRGHLAGGDTDTLSIV